LRNKAGGMAWIKGLDGACACANGHVVRTVRIDQRDLWLIEPNPHFIADRVYSTRSGLAVFPGERVHIVSIKDCHLEPIGDAGITREEVRELYAPKASQRTTA
jgi:hypothetical protein